ncbi:hypothetical protein B0T16DRAFT_495015 [Cercophora newfieldiana]|uniref:Peptidase M20 domain-containing protein 2 n=1 Tax=Cercophora newfieldiana TaxID=92897 RepID=A0AA39Y1N7_9PEZI|nr:hypothetical protein B0T16DRAFT_495015 [Cercophora newfieldiana]
MDRDSDYVIVSINGDEEGNNAGDSPAYLSDIESLIDNNAQPLWALNSFLHDNPELAYRERKAHHALTHFIRARDEGWHVTPSAYGIETAWIAVFDSGKPGPVVSFNVEMDALPGLGHACGHNLIATASLAAGLASAQIMRRHDLGGKVLIFGTPGEEGYRGGKIRLLEQHAYDGVDISLISHPGILHNSPLVRTTAFARLEVEYLGRAAHAAKNPWNGINALDALVISYNAVSALRQQTMPGDTIGLAITNGGGEASNIIHAYASMVCMLHSRTASRLKTLQDKVSGCLRAGGEATGAQVKITVTQGYQDHVPNRVLARSYSRYWRAMPDPPDPQIPPPCAEPQVTWVPSSTDQGNLSRVMPSLNVSFAIPPGPEGGQPHTPDFEVASGTREAFERALRVGKALAGTAVEVLTTEGLLEGVKRGWRRDMDEVGKEEGRG